MAKSKAEREGEIARAEGKPRSASPYNVWFPSESQKRAHVDWLIGWDREDQARTQQARRNK